MNVFDVSNKNWEHKDVEKKTKKNVKVAKNEEQ